MVDGAVLGRAVRGRPVPVFDRVAVTGLLKGYGAT